jgi:hypothetical protein
MHFPKKAEERATMCTTKRHVVAVMVLSKHGKLPKELSMHVKDDDRKKLMQRENLQKLSDEVVVADVVPQRMTALASDNLL